MATIGPGAPHARAHRGARPRRRRRAGREAHAAADHAGAHGGADDGRAARSLPRRRGGGALARRHRDSARRRAHDDRGKTAIDATITALSIARGKRHFVLSEPAHVHVNRHGQRAAHCRERRRGARVAATMRIGRDTLTADATVDAPSLAGAGRLVGVTLGGALHASLHLALDERLTLDATVDGNASGKGRNVRGVARLERQAALWPSSSARRMSKPTASPPAARRWSGWRSTCAASRGERLGHARRPARGERPRGGAGAAVMLVDGTWRTDALQARRPPRCIRRS